MFLRQSEMEELRARYAHIVSSPSAWYDHFVQQLTVPSHTKLPWVADKGSLHYDKQFDPTAAYGMPSIQQQVTALLPDQLLMAQTIFDELNRTDISRNLADSLAYVAKDKKHGKGVLRLQQGMLLVDCIQYKEEVGRIAWQSYNNNGEWFVAFLDINNGARGPEYYHHMHLPEDKRDLNNGPEHRVQVHTNGDVLVVEYLGAQAHTSRLRRVGVHLGDYWL